MFYAGSQIVGVQRSLGSKPMFESTARIPLSPYILVTPVATHFMFSSNKHSDRNHIRCLEYQRHTWILNRECRDWVPLIPPLPLHHYLQILLR